ncbi:MAG: outer membrane beta-barrel protein [Planctomycetaceae bacterium]|nr:outer membrane beta-barrel protein [Planctomycetaceae bacterium]
MKSYFRNFVFALIAASAVYFSGAVSQGAIFNGECDPCEPACEVLPCDPLCNPCTPCGRKSLFGQFEFYGYLQAGLYVNSRGAKTERLRTTNYRGRTVSFAVPDSGNSDLLGTTRLTEFQVNQLWLNLHKEADGKHGLDWGARAEVAFGTDLWLNQSFGDAGFDYGWQDGDYFTAIPQIYAQLAYGDLSVKLGKFEALVGYESGRVEDCFFYSHSHLFMFEPCSYTGALFEYTPSDNFTAAAGYVTGADTSFNNHFDDHGFVGYLSYTFNPRLSASYAVSYSRYGNERFYRDGSLRWYGGNNGALHTVVLTYQLTKKLSYAIQCEYANAKDRQLKIDRQGYGFNNHLIYQINDRWGVGLRAEWAKDADNDPNDFYGGYGFAGLYRGEVQEYTLGVKWTPYKNVSVHSELRYDRAQEEVFNFGRNKDQFSGGFCTVVGF